MDKEIQLPRNQSVVEFISLLLLKILFFVSKEVKGKKKKGNPARQFPKNLGAWKIDLLFNLEYVFNHAEEIKMLLRISEHWYFVTECEGQQVQDGQGRQQAGHQGRADAAVHPQAEPLLLVGKGGGSSLRLDEWAPLHHSVFLQSSG